MPNSDPIVEYDNKCGICGLFMVKKTGLSALDKGGQYRCVRWSYTNEWGWEHD